MDDGRQEIETLLRRAADDERQLLKRERRAERDVAEARADLAREEERYQRAKERLSARQADVAQAESRLRRRQEARATGPEAGPPAPTDGTAVQDESSEVATVAVAGRSSPRDDGGGIGGGRTAGKTRSRAAATPND